MKSRFSFSIFAPMVVCLSSCALLVILLSFIIKKQELDVMILMATLLFFTVWIWVVFGEFRKKVLAITIENQRIQVVSFFGLGKKKVYLLKEFDGFYTISMPSRYKNYEYLFLIRNKSRIVTISEFYHTNYVELKAEITKYSTDLGQREFKWSVELCHII